jgi:hypothetical protein
MFYLAFKIYNLGFNLYIRLYVFCNSIVVFLMAPELYPEIDRVDAHRSIRD